VQEQVSTFNAWIVPGIFIALAAFWCLICTLIGLVSGWNALSTRFTALSKPSGEFLQAGPLFHSVYLRFWGHYSSVVRMISAPDALYLSALFPFRPGHPPLCIPWNEITFGRTKFLWQKYVVLTLGNEERIPLRISEGMARKLGLMERVPSGE
jgi:hypothetical protein